ncbi:MAG: hypothetical protein VB082_09140, partial [Christensenella sp.]|nr:hypothetical protein [Christensenella sp.]
NLPHNPAEMSFGFCFHLLRIPSLFTATVLFFIVPLLCLFSDFLDSLANKTASCKAWCFFVDQRG